MKESTINQLMKMNKKKLIKYCLGYLKANKLITEDELKNLNNMEKDEYNNYIIKKALKGYMNDK